MHGRTLLHLTSSVSSELQRLFSAQLTRMLLGLWISIWFFAYFYENPLHDIVCNYIFRRKIRSCSVNQTRVVHFTSNRKRIIEFFSEVPMFLLILGPGRNSNRHPSRKLSAHLPSTCKHLSPTFHKGLIIFRYLVGVMGLEIWIIFLCEFHC